MAERNLGAAIIRGSAISGSAGLITLLLGFTRSILMARLLLPEHFGIVALALFFTGIAGQLRGFGLDFALIHRQEADETFMGVYFTARVALDIAAFGLLLLAIPLVQRGYPAIPELSAVLPYLVLVAVLGSMSQVQETLIRKNLAFGAMARVDVISSAVMTLVAPFLAWQGWGLWALVAEQVSGQLTRFLLTWFPFRQWRPHFRWSRSEIQWLWQYGKPAWWATSITYLLESFDDWWVGTALGKTSLGYYAKAYEFARYPRRIFSSPIIIVFQPIFAAVQDDRQRLSQAFYRAAYLLIRLGFFGSGMAVLVMPEFILHVIGDKWWPLLLTFRLMLLYAVADPILALMGHLLLATGNPRALRDVRVAQLLFFLPAVILGARLWGIHGVALAANAMLVVGGIRYLQPLRRLVDFSVTRLFALPLILLILAGGAGLWAEQALADAGWLALFAKVGLFVLLFLTPLFIFERDEILQGARMIERVLRRHNR